MLKDVHVSPFSTDTDTVGMNLLDSQRANKGGWLAKLAQTTRKGQLHTSLMISSGGNKNTPGPLHAAKKRRSLHPTQTKGRQKSKLTASRRLDKDRLNVMRRKSAINYTPTSQEMARKEQLSAVWGFFGDFHVLTCEMRRKNVWWFNWRRHCADFVPQEKFADKTPPKNPLFLHCVNELTFIWGLTLNLEVSLSFCDSWKRHGWS